MFRKDFLLFLLILCGVMVAQFVSAVDQSSLNYTNIGTTFAPVVRDTTSTNYQLTGSIDAIVGTSTSAGFIMRSGVPLNDTNPAVCGNGIVEGGESCDNGGSNGACPQSCSASCTTNSCSSPSPGPGAGGGAGGLPATETGVEFSGHAYPLSNVVLLKDGQIATQTIAGPDGKFRIKLTGMQAGSYSFGIYAEDSKGIRSSIFSFPITITTGALATVSGIFLAPTIAVDKEFVKRGDPVTIFGQAVPEAEVTIQVNSDPVFVKADSDEDGVYLYAFNTGLIENGPHTTKSIAQKDGAVSPYSLAVGFEVNDTGEGKPKPACTKADLNCDGRVNLVDFSIAAFWYKQTLSTNFIPIEIERLNGDGKVDLIDFSIMAYYWTG